MKLYIKACIVLILFANQIDIFPQISSSYTRLGLGDNIRRVNKFTKIPNIEGKIVLILGNSV